VKFGIIGLGAVGSLLAYFLNQAGYVPHVVTRSRRERYVLKWGGETHVLQVAVVDELPPVDYTLVAVKAYDTEAVVDKIRGVPTVFQNGIGGLELIRERLGVGFGAVVTYGVARVEGVAEVRGVGEVVLPREAGEVADALRAGGARVRVVEDIEPVRWLKLAVNAAINPITALLRAKNGVVVENPYARLLAAEAAREAGRVAEAVGVRLPADPVEEAMKVAEATKDNVSSMLQDLSQCKRTEVDYINGAVVRLGERHGVEAPVNKALWALVKAAEAACGAV